MVAPAPFPGNRGTPSRILDMSLGLSHLGHEVHVVSYHLKTDTPTNGITVHRIPCVPTYTRMGPGPSFQKLLVLDSLLALKVWKVASQIDFDIIHGHSYEGFLAALPTARQKKKKLIYDAHSTLFDELPSYDFINIKSIASFLDRKVPEWSDHIIAVSETLKDILLKKGIDDSKIAVIPTGVNVRQFEGRDPLIIRRKHNIPAHLKIVMYTGSLANFQGVDYLIEAMALVLQKFPDAVLLLVGNSNMQKYVDACRNMGISGHVVITGDQPFQDIPDYLAAADVVVSPRTVCPGVPQKLANYMASGKAIVGFQGSAKLVTHLESGIVLENGNVTEMAEWIIRLLHNPSLANRLGSSAKWSLLGKYDWITLSRKVQDVYYGLLTH